MRKISLTFCALLLASSLPAFADFCSHCGKSLAKEANFCSNCGKAASGAFESATPADDSKVVKEEIVLPANEDIKSVKEYSFINRIEDLAAQSTARVAFNQCQELKRQNSAKMQKMDLDYPNYSIFRKKLHDLHMKKLAALEKYVEARRASENTIDAARCKAIMAKEVFILSKMNEAIDTLLTNGNTLTNINKVEELVKRVDKTTSNYIVTSQYLKIGNVEVKRNEPIWIEDVTGSQAIVHHMGNNPGDEPAVGYVSVYDLELRTNWLSDGAFYYSPADTSKVVTQTVVRPKQVVNVVIADDDWIYPYRRCWPIFHPRRIPLPPPPPPRYRPAPPPPPRYRPAPPPPPRSSQPISRPAPRMAPVPKFNPVGRKR